MSVFILTVEASKAKPDNHSVISSGNLTILKIYCQIFQNLDSIVKITSRTSQLH
uniref:Uncharacterized protein n=1 Tax=Strigamia maritima TaxID=126957 RepID=T1JPA6_STRMM